MVEKISLQYPGWFLAFCVLAGVAYSFLLYKNESRFSENPSWVKRLMALLRFFSIFFITLLLLSPIIKSLKEDKKDPIILFAEDNSASIKAGMSAESLITLENDVKKLKDDLSKKYKIETLYFGDETGLEMKDKYSAKTTNLSSCVNYIYENYADQNIGSIILFSDGIYNEGSNPTYENAKFNAPIHTVSLGDTSIRKDVYIKNVLHNKIAYLGDKFSIQVDLAASNASGSQTKVKIEKSSDNGNKLIQELPINIEGKNFFKSIDLMLDADQTGIVKYSIMASNIGGEISNVNNRKDIYIEILDGRQNVLILANAPHPDVSALNNIISSNKNYKVKTAFVADAKANVADFDLIILHNLPSDISDASAELLVAKNKGIPVLFIAGTQTNQTKFNLAQDVIKIKGNNKNNEDVEPSLNASFNQFTLSDALKSQLNKFPPLVSQFGVFEAQPTSSVLLYQKIKKIPTKYPLIAYNDKGGMKTGIIAGEGLWKWRINDFVDNAKYENVSEIINKTIQLLTVKEDKRKFRVTLAKNLFKENESIIFDAQLYNDAYEMINDPDVFLTIKDQNRKEYKYNFSKTNKYYTLDAGLFPEGSYSYVATTNYKGQQLTANGKFSIQAIQLENYDLTARHDVMKGISSKFKGKNFYPANISDLSKELLTNESIKPLIFQST
ncbi:MAG: hypothetical protein RLZZ546_921, partial [Bacteroidota bacterium]